MILEGDLPRFVKLNALITEVLRLKSPGVRLLFREALEMHFFKDLKKKIMKDWSGPWPKFWSFC